MGHWPHSPLAGMHVIQANWNTQEGQPNKSTRPFVTMETMDNLIRLSLSYMVTIEWVETLGAWPIGTPKGTPNHLRPLPSVLKPGSPGDPYLVTSNPYLVTGNPYFFRLEPRTCSFEATARAMTTTVGVDCDGHMHDSHAMHPPQAHAHLLSVLTDRRVCLRTVTNAHPRPW